MADIEDVIEYVPRIESSPWVFGPFCWLMTNPRFLERPIPLKGKLNLFYLPDDVAQQVLSQPTHRLDLNDPQIQAYCEAMRPPLEPEQNYLAAAEEYWLAGNLSAGHRAVDACLRLPKEVVQTLMQAADVRIERIISYGHASAPDSWYDQAQHEWVIVLKGAARLQFEDEMVEMKPGDFINIAAFRKHRVDWTTPDEPTIWLGVRYRGEKA